MKLLISGAGSGLGRYLHEALGGIGLTRQNADEALDEASSGVDAIIHCAFNPNAHVEASALYGYARDNILLTERLTAVPHGMFIYLSTVDVYPKSDTVHTEDERIEADGSIGLYGLTKLISESIVGECAKGPLVIRAGAMLGPYSRKNSLIRIAGGEAALTLSADSSFNYVLHGDMLKFIRLSLEKGVSGTYNAVSSDNVTLGEVANMLGRIVRFGGYRYDAGSVANAKIRARCPSFEKGSREVITSFLRERTNV